MARSVIRSGDEGVSPGAQDIHSINLNKLYVCGEGRHFGLAA
jgi:hypothetical protein